jgi:hypothetical protein
MNNEVYEELKKLMNCFPDSYINRQLEFILIPKTNTFFSLGRLFDKRRCYFKGFDVVHERYC